MLAPGSADRLRLHFPGSDGLGPPVFEGTILNEQFRLLLVEDNPGDAQLARIQLSDLQEHDFDIITVSTLNRAIDVVSAAPVDGIILDLGLPDSTGIETLRRLREMAGDVALIVLSGNETAELRLSAFAEGAYDFISKNEPTTRLLARSVLYAMERHRAQTLQRQVQKLVTVVPDAVIVVDGQNIVRFVNDAAEALFGLEHGQLMGEHLGFATSHDEPHDIEIARQGEVRTAEIRVAEIEWAGAPARLASVRDVTEQRHMAEQLRQAQKMEAVGLLAGGVAHDFNNLVLVMMGSADLIADELEQLPDSPRLQDLVEELQQATERARALTTQLMLFSGRRPNDPKVVDLNQAVRDVYRLLRRTLPANIDAVILPAEELWPVTIDPGQLSQVIINLTVNARDALVDGGRIEIALSNLQQHEASDGLPEGDYAVLKVTDNGTGIAPDHLEQIFQPFFTTKDQGKGTGLGLPTCRGIIRQAKGDIIVDSEVGRGTSFSVLLPRSTDAPDLLRHERNAAPLQGNEIILLVEDDPAVSRMTAKILGNSGYTVLTASNGEEALRIAGRHAAPIHLLLSDVVMPQMGGPELADRIENEVPGIRILMMSGYEDDNSARAGNTRALLHKPFLPHELLKCVRQLLDDPNRS